MASFLETERISAGGTPRLHKSNYDAVRYRMLNLFDEALTDGEEIGTTATFSSYMKRIHSFKPDVVLFPAYSALPFADAVRGFYDTVGQDTPRLTHIMANRFLANPRLSARTRTGIIERELERLTADYSGATGVVMDHFVCNGDTERFAHELMEQSNITVKHIGLPAVRWYADIDEEEKLDMSIRSLSHPRHTAFMRDIGRRAATRMGPQL